MPIFQGAIFPLVPFCGSSLAPVCLRPARRTVEGLFSGRLIDTSADQHPGHVSLFSPTPFFSSFFSLFSKVWSTTKGPLTVLRGLNYVGAETFQDQPSTFFFFSLSHHKTIKLSMVKECVVVFRIDKQEPQKKGSLGRITLPDLICLVTKGWFADHPRPMPRAPSFRDLERCHYPYSTLHMCLYNNTCSMTLIKASLEVYLRRSLYQ
ncbi:hypothetical protein QBC38DRAFT_250533 [Podospora fimiseda]|uniref:Uncharacterized protein n=1 Tax=Podospora fimiseda TaxID=252190 RepID=A0AAN7BM93_9PEZI|nr:hypothetical protein QBC38DRAFT_250533 [Podospora fimiseda]